MAHFAKVINGDVIQVIVAEPEFIESGELGEPTTWIQCSYNTFGNQHYNPETQLPDDGTPLRGNFQSIGDTYDEDLDVFYAPQPHPSWALNTSTYSWEPPTPHPSNATVPLSWDEETTSWVEITNEGNGETS